MSMTEEALRAENRWLKNRIKDLTRLDDWPVIGRALLCKPQEAKVLTLLWARRDVQFVSRESIYTEVFQRPDGDGPTSNVVTSTIYGLRQALRDAKTPRGITTHYGAGYSITRELAAWIDRLFAEDDQ